MMIPVTAGAVLLKGVRLAGDGIPEGLLVPMIVGIVTSGIAGWIAVWGTLKLVRTHSFMPFVIYRVALGRGCPVGRGGRLAGLTRFMARAGG